MMLIRDLVTPRQTWSTCPGYLLHSILLPSISYTNTYKYVSIQNAGVSITLSKKKTELAQHVHVKVIVE
jgi:hypothetical protein